MSEKPGIEAESPATVQITCAGPGPAHSFEHVRRAGRPPLYCEDHRAPKHVRRSQNAHVLRRSMASEMEEQAAASMHATRALRLAAALRVFPDVATAAGYAGVSERGEELAALVAEARRDHESIVTGDLRAVSHVAASSIVILSADLMARRAEIPARDLAQFARFSLQALDDLKGEGTSHTYISFSLAITPYPADGKLTEEQRARVQGRIAGGKASSEDGSGED